MTLAKQVPKLPTTLAMRSQPRETRLFVRGNPERPGDVVAPGVPRFLHPLAGGQTDAARPGPLARGAGEPAGRRAVTVNRFWQHYFGSGLVETANDFGVQTPAAGAPGAARLAGLRVRRPRLEHESHAPADRHVGHVPAELGRASRLAGDRSAAIGCWHGSGGCASKPKIVRDLSLVGRRLAESSASAVPSVFPYQPAGVLDDRATKATWTISPGADRYRRGLYTWIWRLTPHPMLALFDAPDASMACTRRDRSNTPVQALTMLNDPTFVESARGLARRVIAERRTTRARLDRAFAICFEPPPSER